MKLSRKSVSKFQEGGAMMPEDPAASADMGAPAEEPQGQQDPLMMLAQMAAQAVQEGNCETALQVCQAFLQLVQQAQGGTPAEEPVYYRKGGKLCVKR